jgi:glutamyl-tRNA synthetase
MVRVRYAPSPTGMPHVGNIRTALFNWVFARHHGGKFIVRIEDTDRARFVEGSEQAILHSLRWLGLDWDEGPEVGGPYAPYYQSQRLEIYQRIAHQLVEEGKAYKCFCTPEELEQMRAQQRAQGAAATMYDRRCRKLTPAEVKAREDAGLPYVIRFKMPLEGTAEYDDLIHGRTVFQNKLTDDFVMLKSDGFPTYHLANVVDDHLMEVTHVLRGDEWVSSMPRHLNLYQSARLGAAAVRAPAPAAGTRQAETLQAARRSGVHRLHPTGLPARSDVQLFSHLRLEPWRRPRDSQP